MMMAVPAGAIVMVITRIIVTVIAMAMATIPDTA
jgi:hypothetical protein